MPQEQWIVQCYSCKTYQVHIVKKAKKWNCKMCGEQQSLKRTFGRGDGKFCREQVQKLNMLKMSEDQEFIYPEEDMYYPLQEMSEGMDKFVPASNSDISDHTAKTSKWETFIDVVEDDTDSDGSSGALTTFQSSINSRKDVKHKSILNHDSKEPRKRWLSYDSTASYFSSEQHDYVSGESSNNSEDMDSYDEQGGMLHCAEKENTKWSQFTRNVPSSCNFINASQRGINAEHISNERSKQPVEENVNTFSRSTTDVSNTLNISDMSSHSTDIGIYRNITTENLSHQNVPSSFKLDLGQQATNKKDEMVATTNNYQNTGLQKDNVNKKFQWLNKYDLKNLDDMLTLD